MRRLLMTLGILALLAVAATPAAADSVQIQFTGVTFSFNSGSGFCDAGGCSAAPASSFNFSSSGTLVSMDFLNLTTGTTIGSLNNPPNTLATDFWLVFAGSVPASGTVSGTSGFWDIASSSAGWGLAVNITDWTVITGPGGALTILFSGGTSNIWNQALPFSITFNGPVTFSFSCTSWNGTSCTGDATMTAQATVPEPGTLALLGTGLVGLAGLRRRPE